MGYRQTWHCEHEDPFWGCSECGRANWPFRTRERVDYDLDLTNALWNLAWHANPSEMDAGGEHCDHEQWYDEALTTLEGLLQDESRSPEDRIRLALRFVKRTSALTYCDIVYPTVIADAFHGAYVALGDPPNVMSQLLESERSNGAHRR